MTAMLTTAGAVFLTSGARLSSDGPASTRGPGSVSPAGIIRATTPPRSPVSSISNSSRAIGSRDSSVRRSAILALRHLAFGGAAAELVREPLPCRGKGEAHGVDAIALTGRRRTVVEHMALVRSATGTDDLRAHHSVVRVADIFEVPFSERL